MTTLTHTDRLHTTTVAALLLVILGCGLSNAALGEFAEDIYDEVDEDIAPCDDTNGSPDPCEYDGSGSGDFRDLPGDPTYDDVDVTPRTGRQPPEEPEPVAADQPYEYDDETQEEYDPAYGDEPLTHGASGFGGGGGGGGGGSAGGMDDSYGEYNYQPGSGPCQVLKGERCYMLPNPGDEVEPTPEPVPEHEGGFPEQSRNTNVRHTQTRVSSPYGGGSPFGGRGSPLGSSANSRGLTASENDSRSGGTNGSNYDDGSISAACMNELQAAGTEYVSCSQNVSQGSTCGIMSQGAQCGQTFINRIQYSSCPAHVKRANIDGIRSLNSQFQAGASAVCTNR